MNKHPKHTEIPDFPGGEKQTGNVYASARFWAYAAVFGALWGAAEVGLGSLLHTMRISFTGQILTCVGVIILAAQRRIFPYRGSSAACGAVAALCKSISPGGIILGPMIGIFMEAVCFEAATIALPESRILTAIGGVLALWWTIAQSLISHVIYFGARVIELYLELLKRASEFFGFETSHGWIILVLPALILTISGIAAAEIGRILGNSAQLRLAEIRESNGY